MEESRSRFINISSTLSILRYFDNDFAISGFISCDANCKPIDFNLKRYNNFTDELIFENNTFFDIMFIF